MDRMEGGPGLRRSLTGVRPGAGFHSLSTYGLIAVGGGIARALRH